MLRFGLCCIFWNEPIKFRTTTAMALSKLSEGDRLEKLSELISTNADALMAALKFCDRHCIGSFRVNSQILPVKTHPEQGYDIEHLPGATALKDKFKTCGDFAKAHNIRTTFHPDQFVVLNSPNNDVVRNSIRELEYQCQVGSWINADVINIHGGGVYGDKMTALDRLTQNIKQLSAEVRSRLTLENDDKSFTPSNLLPVCLQTGLPFVYDIHHHRCNPDALSIAEVTANTLDTWNREPLFHISSPRDGWGGPKPNRHHDYINLHDFPEEWRSLTSLTLEVEAKAKELAVLKLMKELKTFRS